MSRYDIDRFCPVERKRNRPVSWWSIALCIASWILVGIYFAQGLVPGN